MSTPQRERSEEYDSRLRKSSSSRPRPDAAPLTGNETRKDLDFPAYVRFIGARCCGGGGSGKSVGIGFGGERTEGNEGVRRARLGVEFPDRPVLSIEDSVLDRPSMRLASFPGDPDADAAGDAASNIWDKSLGILESVGGVSRFRRFGISSSLPAVSMGFLLMELRP